MLNVNTLMRRQQHTLTHRCLKKKKKNIQQGRKTKKKNQLNRDFIKEIYSQ